MFQYWVVECRSTVVAVIYNNTKLCTDITVLLNMVITVKKNFTR